MTLFQNYLLFLQRAIPSLYIQLDSIYSVNPDGRFQRLAPILRTSPYPSSDITVPSYLPTTSPASQPYTSEMQPSPDSTEWQVANRQRLAAIELKREKTQELERQARKRKLDDTARRPEP